MQENNEKLIPYVRIPGGIAGFFDSVKRSIFSAERQRSYLPTTPRLKLSSWPEIEAKPAVDHLRVIVPRDEVRRQDIKPALSILRKLLKSPEVARAYRERVDIVFDGYNDDPLELGEIREVRDYVRKLDARFPFWLFFLSKELPGLRHIISCRLLPFLTDEGKSEHHSSQLEHLLDKRWFPAMNIVAEFAELNAKEIADLTGGFLWYVKTGRLRPQINDD